MAILGGRKVSDKIGVIDSLLEKVDVLMIGGAMAYTFFKSMGYNVGNSICELDKLEVAKEIMKKAEEKGVKLLLPVDTKVGKEFSPTTESQTVRFTDIPDGWEGFYIGQATIDLYSQEVKNAKTVIWNGHLGLFEFDQFAIGTNSIAKALADVDAVKIIGGGDSVNAVKRLGFADKMTHISTGGVASLELTGTYTGAYNGFDVTGELGAAKGLDTVKTEALDSKYSVTIDGKTTQHESYSNDISVDSTRIGVSLKSTGKTTISSGLDFKKTADGISKLVDAYNSSLKLLNDNYDRGTGVYKQLRNLVGGLGSEKSLEKLGITVNKDATLKFDKSVLQKNMKEHPSLTKDLISSAANMAYNKGAAGMRVNSSTLINNDIEAAQADAMNNPYQAFNMYSKTGAYTLNNYYALGMMMNYLV